MIPSEERIRGIFETAPASVAAMPGASEMSPLSPAREVLLSTLLGASLWASLVAAIVKHVT